MEKLENVVDIKENNKTLTTTENIEVEEEGDSKTKKYSLVELEDLLSQGKIPPGIKEYNDLPDDNPVGSENKIKKVKKVVLLYNFSHGN